MDESLLLRALGALLLVGGLIGLCALGGRWLQARGMLLGSTAGRTRRLRVVEQLALDGRRRLVLVEKDGAEMLLAIGEDVRVVEARGSRDA